MATREEMLGRIRQALRPRGEAHRTESAPQTPWSLAHQVLSNQQLISKFEEEFRRIGGKPARASSRPDLEGKLNEIVDLHQGTSVVLSANPLLERLCLRTALGTNHGVAVWDGKPEAASAGPAETAFREAVFAAEVGITGVDFALAETGSLVVTSQTEGSQLSSLAPPVHVALYRPQQVVATLDEVLERLPLAARGGESGRSVVFITGPSRTGDIELTITLGVHGPKEIYAILVEDGCLAEEQ